MRKKSEDDDIDKLAAAYLASQGNKQTTIAAKLGLSQPVVSRLLKEAEGTYWREHVQFIEEKIDDIKKLRMFERIGRSSDLARRLSDVSQKYVGRCGPLVRVFSSHSERSEKGKMPQFAREAAPYVKSLFERAETCGVTWGGMLGHLVAAMNSLAVPPPWTHRKLKIVPLSGEPLGDEPTVFSSSSLSQQLGSLVNGADYNGPYLGMVPAFIPEEGFSPEGINAIWRLIGLVQSYGEIFGTEGTELNGKRPLAECLDMILTSVGPAERPLGFLKGRLLESGRVKTDELQQLIVGDIGGVCIPRSGLSEKQTAQLKSVTDRWTGLKREHLEACAIRAAQDNPVSGKPGVVVVSHGANRAELVYEAIKLGLINQLVIDQELAAGLETFATGASN